MRKRTSIIGIISIVIISAGVVLRILHRPGWPLLLASGVTLFVAAFSTSFLIDKLSMETRRASKISYAVLFIAFVLVTLSGMLKILHLTGALVLSYIGLAMFLIYTVFFTRQQEGRKLRIRKDRQLAAILFTDIVGFTRMMGENEEHTLLALDKNRKIQKRWIRKYRGKWLKEMGDGSIAIFYTASEALLCGKAIQEEIREKENFQVRMGVHISEIVFTDDDAFGDGMNVASRISDHAEGGEICFSDTVYQNVKNREELEIHSMGSVDLKNVDYPLNLFKIASSP